MEDLKKLIEKMENEMRKSLIKDGDYDEEGVKGIDEEGIKIAVYEDLKDSLNYLFSDVIY
tara:strand:- start:678 stop:857 length:180 start_codon:yes stop_codon:yes gene_type:complete